MNVKIVFHSIMVDDEGSVSQEQYLEFSRLVWGLVFGLMIYMGFFYMLVLQTRLYFLFLLLMAFCSSIALLQILSSFFELEMRHILDSLGAFDCEKRLSYNLIGDSD